MTSRDRVMQSLDFRATDRVPLDLGGMRSTGISAFAYPGLRAALGLPEAPAPDVRHEARCSRCPSATCSTRSAATWCTSPSTSARTRSTSRSAGFPYDFNGRLRRARPAPRCVAGPWPDGTLEQRGRRLGGDHAAGLVRVRLRARRGAARPRGGDRRAGLGGEATRASRPARVHRGAGGRDRGLSPAGPRVDRSRGVPERVAVGDRLPRRHGRVLHALPAAPRVGARAAPPGGRPHGPPGRGAPARDRDSVDVVMLAADDQGTQNGPILPPAVFRDLYVPAYRRITDACHRAAPGSSCSSTPAARSTICCPT